MILAWALLVCLGLLWATRTNVLICGRTRGGKTLAAARSVVEGDEAGVHIDPHRDNYTFVLMTHLEGNVLHDDLGGPHGLPYDLLVPSDDEDENYRRATAFVGVLLRGRDGGGLEKTPLMGEWLFAALLLYLFQRYRQPLTVLPYAFRPGTEEFDRLVSGVSLRDVAAQFRQAAKLTIRGQRSEWGSAARLLSETFRGPTASPPSRQSLSTSGGAS